LNLLSNFVFAFSLVLLVSLPEGFINPSKYIYLFKEKYQ
jgi:ATP-binding cassette subfamily C (CFTR/MRP) protein 1